MKSLPFLLARLTTLEVGPAVKRTKRKALGAALMAAFGIVALVFLLVAVYVALAESLGGVEAALIIAAVAIVLIVGVWIWLKIEAARERKRARVRASSRAALVSGVAVSVLPQLLKSKAALAIGLPAALALGYMVLSGDDAGDDTG